jgi:hypothetical protein
MASQDTVLSVQPVRHSNCREGSLWQGAIVTMAATNKCLAQMNKSPDGGGATKERNRQ